MKFSNILNLCFYRLFSKQFPGFDVSPFRLFYFIIIIALLCVLVDSTTKLQIQLVAGRRSCVSFYTLFYILNALDHAGN